MHAQSAESLVKRGLARYGELVAAGSRSLDCFFERLAQAWRELVGIGLNLAGSARLAPRPQRTRTGPTLRGRCWPLPIVSVWNDDLQSRPRADLVSGIYRLFFLLQKRDDDSDGLLGLFLHNPVARIDDDGTANVGGGKANFRCQLGAI
jgi:hypothetical protein